MKIDKGGVKKCLHDKKHGWEFNTWQKQWLEYMTITMVGKVIAKVQKILEAKY